MRVLTIIMAGMVACGAWGVGEFNGSTGYVGANPASSSINNNTEGTVMFWQLINDNTANANTWVAVRDATDSADSVFWVKNYGVSTAGAIEAGIREAGTWLWKFVYDADGTIIQNAQWQHIALVVRSTGNSIYVDAKLQTVPAGDYTHGSASSPQWFDDINDIDEVTIGGNSGAAFFGFNGQIDDLRIISRALSQAEIADIYRERARIRNYTAYTNAIATGVFEDSVAYHDVVGGTNYLELHWDGNLDGYGYGEAAVEVKDISGSGNHGTLGSVATSDPVWFSSQDGQQGLYEFQVAYGAYIDLLDSVVSDPDWSVLGDNITIACRFRPYLVANTAVGAWYPNYTIIELRGEGVGSHVAFSFGVDDSNMHLGVSDNYTTGAEREWSTSTLSINQWYDMAVVINGDDFAFYLDGVLDGTGTFATATGDRTTAAQTANVQIGTRSRDGGQKDSAFCAGFLDYIAVYPSSLSSNQLYSLDLGNYPTNTPVLDMRFDRESWKARDQSIHQHTLTVTGGVVQKEK